VSASFRRPLLGRSDLTSLSDFLGDKPFFMGEQPTILDATAFGFLVNVLWCPIKSPLKDHAKQLENLLQFCDRMKRRRCEARSADPETGEKISVS
jgi:glutathione S-transferase